MTLTAVVGGLQSLRRDRFLRDSAWLTFALSTVNAANYVLNAVLGRQLGRDGYGEVAALLSLLFILNVPTSAVQTLVTREINRGGIEAVSEVVRHSWRTVIPWAAVTFVVALALSPLIARFLNLDSTVPAVLLAPLLVLALAVPIYRGVLQGRRRFPALTVNIATEAALRVAGAVVLVAIGLGAPGVLGAFGVALAAALGLGLVSTRGERGRHGVPASGSRTSIGDLLPVIASLGLITALFNIDVVLARHYLAGSASGEYAAISLTGRVIFYLTSSVGGAVVASPDLAHSLARRRLVAKALAVVVGAGLVAEVVFLVVAAPVVGAVFGASYRSAASALPVLGAGMLALAAANLLTYFLIAMRSTRCVLVLGAAAALEATLIAWHHDSVEAIAVAFTTAAVAAAAGVAAMATTALTSPSWELS